MKIENLSKLKNIKWLDLSFNYISEIEGLEELENLTDLSLYSNQIKEVKNLDKNRKLNVLSVGNNQIMDCKPMAKYLKRFSNLQALCCHMNPFCRDEESVKKILEENITEHRYPGSYDPIITGLLGLKYLDWKPIDEDYREKVINNSLSQGKEDKEAKEAENEERLMEERAALHNADLDEIIDFFPRVIENIKDEISNSLTWKNKACVIFGLYNRKLGNTFWYYENDQKQIERLIMRNYENINLFQHFVNSVKIYLYKIQKHKVVKYYMKVMSSNYLKSTNFSEWELATGNIS
jgi:Leucine-rich repeat (LRR) protein